MSVVSAELRANGSAPYRVAFYGAGDAAEVAYVSLREVGLELVGVVDARTTSAFFDFHVRPPAELDARRAGFFAADRDAAAGRGTRVRAVLAARGVPPEQVFWL